MKEGERRSAPLLMLNETRVERHAPGGTNSRLPARGVADVDSPGGPASRLSGQPPPKSRKNIRSVGPPPFLGPTMKPHRRPKIHHISGRSSGPADGAMRLRPAARPDRALPGRSHRSRRGSASRASSTATMSPSDRSRSAASAAPRILAIAWSSPTTRMPSPGALRSSPPPTGRRRPQDPAHVVVGDPRRHVLGQGVGDEVHGLLELEHRRPALGAGRDAVSRPTTGHDAEHEQRTEPRGRSPATVTASRGTQAARERGRHSRRLVTVTRCRCAGRAARGGRWGHRRAARTTWPA